MEVIVYPFRDGSVCQTDATFLHPETSQDFSWIGKMSPEEWGASDPTSSTHDMMLEPPGQNFLFTVWSPDFPSRITIKLLVCLLLLPVVFSSSRIRRQFVTGVTTRCCLHQLYSLASFWNKTGKWSADTSSKKETRVHSFTSRWRQHSALFTLI